MAGLAAGLPLAVALLAMAPAGGAMEQESAPAEVGLPAPDPRFSILGSEQCRACHRALHETWRDGPHANAAASLSFEESFDARCQPCHVPHVDALEPAVGCEACHGAGSAYAELDVMIDPFKRTAAGLVDPAQRCVACHNPGHSFHVERDLAAAARRIHPATLEPGSR